MENLENTVNTWERLGEVYYRRYHLSKMKEINYKLDYSACHIAVSRNGGLVAFVRKSKRFIMDVTNPIKDSIRIFYQDGTAVRPIKFGNEKEKNIIFFDFTNEENLICVMHDGRLYKFDIFTSSYTFKIMDSQFMENHIIDAKLFEEGLVCLTANGNFYVISDLRDPKPTLFCSIKKLFDEYIPSDYLFVPQNISSSRGIELLLPHPKHGLINILDNGEVKYAKHSNFTNFNKSCGNDVASSDDLGKILNIIISPSNQFIAIFNEIGNVFVFPSSWDIEEIPRHTSMTKLSFKPNPYQIMWCSEDCVVAVNNGSIFLIGPENKLFKWDIVKSFSNSSGSSANLHCIPEVDGIRMFYDDNVEFVQKVNEDLYLSIFYVSVDPAKKLLEAFKYAEEKRPNCGEEILNIRKELPEAVNRLLVAATTQWDITNQSYLMKAAQHGKTFLNKEEFNFNQFVSICRSLRILNNLRTYDYPRLITYEQFKKLDSKKLINRLIKTQNFFSAFEISHYLNLKKRKVYQKWAVAQIKNLPMGLIKSEEIGFFREIDKKLSEVQGISYIKLAKKALRYGKEEIGIKFLENEKSILTKIPQYIELRKWDMALELAFETYDSNVIYTVIDKIMISESIETFKQIVSKYKKAEPIVLKYLKTNHEGLVKEFLELKRNWEGLFFYHLECFFQAQTLDSRRRNIKEIKNYLKILDGMKEKDLSVDWKFYKLYIEDLEKSLIFKRDLLQEDIIKQTDITTLDNSILDCYKTMIKCEKMGLVEAKNKQLFDVSTRKLSILRIKTYSEMSQFDGIVLLSNNMKSCNLNPLHFAELYLTCKMFDKATDWIKKIREEDYLDYKYAMLKYMEKYYDALELVVSNKRIPLIKDILNKAPDLGGKPLDELLAKYKVHL